LGDIHPIVLFAQLEHFAKPVTEKSRTEMIHHYDAARLVGFRAG
jgi:hypothetical protein